MSEEVRKRFNELFEEELRNLNPSQRIAVTNIAGPVLVIAGPGTGKTHILSARIGNILKETDTQPHNILCLTFTDAGVLAMRDRLQQFIGPDAHKVHIYTFHSFCNTIIQDNLELFGRFEMESVSQLERVEIIREMIDELPEHNILKKGRWDIYHYETHLGNLFRQMKSEYWAPDYIEKEIDRYLESIPAREEYIYKRNTKHSKMGDLKQKKVDAITDRLEKLRVGTQLFDTYKKKMKERNRYDYEDMIHWVLEEFKQNEALLRQYQEQYLYFLVDEYQDTNGSQNKILASLIKYWDNPNVFVVGDDDQSIFEFQGARLRNIMDFYKEHQPGIQLVMLKDNYRSSQHILDASKKIIDHNNERIIRNIEGLEKSLVARSDEFAQSVILPKIIQYPNKMHEDAAIANEIERLHQNGFPLNEVAVIYAKHKQARNIIALLERKRIPYNTKRRVNILDLPLVDNLRTFLEYLYFEYKTPNTGEEFLFKLMHFDYLGIHPSDLNKLSNYMSKYGQVRNISWRAVIENPEELDKIEFRHPEAIYRFSELINGLLADIGNYRCLAFLERLINRSGLLKHVLEHDEKSWLLQIIGTFFDFVRKETDKNPRLTVKRLLDILSNMDDNKLPIGVNKTISAENGVNLLTAHGSKGLEFQVVFMVDAGKDWDATAAGKRYNFFLPETITQSSEESDALEARRRLFYVAMTRAKERLYISYAEKNNDASPLPRSQFIDELLREDQLGLTVEERVLEPEDIIAIQGLLLMELEAPTIDAQERDAVAELLEGFVLSVSSMNRYQSCPLSFYYEYVLRIPSVPNEAATYGTCMHNALKRLFDRMLADEKREFPERDELVDFFEKEMKRRRHYFSKKGYNRRMNMGKRNLKAYYSSNIATWEKSVIPEMDIRNVEFRGVPLKGSLDKVVNLGDQQAKVVDYKTGSLDDKKLKTPTEKNPEGGIYWRQLYFYKILYENYRDNPRRIIQGEIAYLETDRKNEFPVKPLRFDEEYENHVGEMMVDSYKSIMNQEFYEGCGKDTCKWCNFVKKNVMVDSFSDEDAGDLDD